MKELKEKESREYTVPLRKVFAQPYSKRINKAVKELRKFMGKHLRFSAQNIAISNALNQELWRKGFNLDRRLEVAAVLVGQKLWLYPKGSKEIKEALEGKPEKKKEEKKKKEKKKKPEEKKPKEEKKKELSEEEKKKEEKRKKEEQKIRERAIKAEAKGK